MILLVDLKPHYLSIKDEIDQAIARVLESSQFVLGDEVAAFEEEFAAYGQARYAVGVHSGTSALHKTLSNLLKDLLLQYLQKYFGIS